MKMLKSDVKCNVEGCERNAISSVRVDDSYWFGLCFEEHSSASYTEHHLKDGYTVREDEHGDWHIVQMEIPA